MKINFYLIASFPAAPLALPLYYDCIIATKPKVQDLHVYMKFYWNLLSACDVLQWSVRITKHRNLKKKIK